MKITALATLALGLGLSGCQMIARDYYYRIVLVNLSQEKITETRVLDSSGEYNYGCGNLVPSGYAANAGPMETAPNDVFTVRWKDGKGHEHQQIFDLRERVKRTFKGEIVFIHGVDKKFTVETFASQRQYPIPPQRPSNVEPPNS